MNASEHERRLIEAITHLRQGRLDEARTRLEGLCADDRSDFESRYYLSQALAMQGDLAGAEAAARAAVQLRPDSAEFQNQLGAMLAANERYEEALAALDAAVRLSPGLAVAQNRRGIVLQRLKRLKDAALAYHQAVAADPAYGEAWSNLANALSRLGLPQESERAYRRAFELQPGNAAAYADYGAVLEELGKMAESLEAFVHAAELEPDNPLYLVYLPHVRKTTSADDPVVVKLLELAAREHEFEVPQRVQIHFALGQAFDDAGDPDRAFEHWNVANALQRASIDYRQDDELDAWHRIARVFTAEFIASRSGAGARGRTPVFIFGMPRSGTTLIEQILASHPGVHPAGELDVLERIVHAVLGIGEDAPVPEAAIVGLPAAKWREIGEKYLAYTRAEAPDALRITDKMPFNFRMLGVIAIALPGARLIYARRNPLDVGVSCYTKRFFDAIAWSFDLAEIGRCARASEELMAHWHRVLPAGTMLDVEYESVVADLEGQARRIVDFVGLPWDERCLRFYETQRAVRTASVQQVRRPLYASSVGRWRTYAKHLGPLFEALGVDPETGERA